MSCCLGKLEENSEEISSVALLSPACFHLLSLGKFIADLTQNLECGSAQPSFLCHNFDVMFVIWYNMSFMSYDAYDIKIWNESISSILESKETSGPQQSRQLIRFWLKNCFKIEKLKKGSDNFFLYKFWESFVFLGPKRWSWRQHFPASLRLKIYDFENLMVQWMGPGGFLIQIRKLMHYAPP